MAVHCEAFQGGRKDQRGPEVGRAVPLSVARELPCWEDAQGGAEAPPRQGAGGKATGTVRSGSGRHSPLEGVEGC